MIAVPDTPGDDFDEDEEYRGEIEIVVDQIPIQMKVE
jgi:hypothetical protein